MNNITDYIIKQKHAGGRPDEFKQEYCAGVIGHMAQGLSLESYAGVIDCSKKTLYNWMNSHEEFLHAVAKGRQKGLLLWEKMGIQGSAGKLKGFNSKSWEFNMQNRFKEDWKLRHDITSDDKKIELPTLFIPEEKK